MVKFVTIHGLGAIFRVLLRKNRPSLFYHILTECAAWRIPVPCIITKFITFHGLGAAHSNDSGRYLEFCCAKIAPHS